MESQSHRGAGADEPPEHPGSGTNPEVDGARFVRLGLLFYGALLVAAVVWRVGVYREPILFASDVAAAEGLSPARDAALGLAAGALLIGLSNWLTRSTAFGDRLARELAAALGRISVPDALLLACASGIAEEAFFRGALQPRVGWIAASVLFGCVHFVPRREFLPWTGFALVAGFVFAGLFAATGNLVAPICAHALVNGVNLPMLSRRYGPDAAAEERARRTPPPRP